MIGDIDWLGLVSRPSNVPHHGSRLPAPLISSHRMMVFFFYSSLPFKYKNCCPALPFPPPSNIRSFFLMSSTFFRLIQFGWGEKPVLLDYIYFPIRSENGLFRYLLLPPPTPSFSSLLTSSLFPLSLFH